MIPDGDCFVHPVVQIAVVNDDPAVPGDPTTDAVRPEQLPAYHPAVVELVDIRAVRSPDIVMNGVHCALCIQIQSFDARVRPGVQRAESGSVVQWEIPDTSKLGSGQEQHPAIMQPDAILEPSQVCIVIDISSPKQSLILCFDVIFPRINDYILLAVYRLIDSLSEGLILHTLPDRNLGGSRKECHGYRKR